MARKAKPSAIAGPPRKRLSMVRENAAGDFIQPGSNYSEEELEFLRAVEAFKRQNGRPFPSFTEILSVAKALGYRKVAELAPQPGLAREKRTAAQD